MDKDPVPGGGWLVWDDEVGARRFAEQEGLVVKRVIAANHSLYPLNWNTLTVLVPGIAKPEHTSEREAA
jgi:hypothetical protein